MLLRCQRALLGRLEAESSPCVGQTPPPHQLPKLNSAAHERRVPRCRRSRDSVMEAARRALGSTAFAGAPLPRHVSTCRTCPSTAEKECLPRAMAVRARTALPAAFVLLLALSVGVSRQRLAAMQRSSAAGKLRVENTPDGARTCRGESRVLRGARTRRARRAAAPHAVTTAEASRAAASASTYEMEVDTPEAFSFVGRGPRVCAPASLHASDAARTRRRICRRRCGAARRAPSPAARGRRRCTSTRRKPRLSSCCAARWAIC